MQVSASAAVRLGLVAAALGVTLADRTWADFLPGGVYVPSTPVEPIDPWPAQIYVYNPATGQFRVFATYPAGIPGDSFAGLAFTPDGSALRAADPRGGHIMEIDGDGNVSVVLGLADGIRLPVGGNAIGYDRNGDFYVHNYPPHILRFPVEGGPAEVFATQADLAAPWETSGPLAFPAEGGCTSPRSTVSRSLGSQRPTRGGVFDVLPSGMASLAAGGPGSLFAITDEAVYRYEVGDPSSRELIARFTSGLNSAIALLSNGSTQYVQEFREDLFALDVATGVLQNLGRPAGKEARLMGGIAVYVPEPSSAVISAWVLGLVLRQKPR